ncbi:MAG: hypothetical protein ACYC23_21755 [Limisphaerales bacterium]
MKQTQTPSAIGVIQTLFLGSLLCLCGCTTFKVRIQDNIKPSQPVVAALCKHAKSAHIAINTTLPSGHYEFAHVAAEKSLFLRVKKDTELTWVLDIPEDAIHADQIDSTKLKGTIEFSQPVFAYMNPGAGLALKRIEVDKGEATITHRLGRSLVAMLLELGRVSGKGEVLPSSRQWLNRMKLFQVEVVLKEAEDLSVGDSAFASIKEGTRVSVEHVKMLSTLAFE